MGFFNFLKNKTKPEEKISRTAILNTQYGTARWPDKNYENFAKETYMKNAIAYRCIFYISSSLASVRWGLYKNSGDDKIKITGDPVNKILKRANPKESFVFLIQKLVGYLLISGNSYLEKVSPSTQIIRELYCLRPDKMTIKINKDTGIIERYNYDQRLEFEVDPITLKSDILHVKMFHPLDEFFGLSVTEPLAREIDSSNEATEWQKKVFENEGRPGMAVFVHGFLDDGAWERLDKQLNNKSGAGNAGKPIIIEGESTGDIKPYAWSPKEMDWIESNRELSRRICIGYGVPPMLLGIPGDNTYANMKEARIAFWEETIIYYLELAKGELNNWLFSEEENKFIDFDITHTPAMQNKNETLFNLIKDANFLTINEKRKITGWEKIEGGDVLLIDGGKMTLDQLILTEEMSNDPANNDENQDEIDQEEVRKLIALGYDENIAKRMIALVDEY
jgi:HK97 family phage portal protein